MVRIKSDEQNCLSVILNEPHFQIVCSQHTEVLLFFFLGVVSPYAVVEAGGEAQPRQVGRQEQGGCAADGIPRQHGGSDGPSEKNYLYECQFQLVCTKEDRSPGPVQSQL